jgi:hypothetical protein
VIVMVMVLMNSIRAVCSDCPLGIGEKDLLLDDTPLVCVKTVLDGFKKGEWGGEGRGGGEMK